MNNNESIRKKPCAFILFVYKILCKDGKSIADSTSRTDNSKHKAALCDVEARQSYAEVSILPLPSWVN